ncbi:MAG: Lrp/AsnC family transcriptional regulator [Candidatus Thorarchaeota archaeon]
MRQTLVMNNVGNSRSGMGDTLRDIIPSESLSSQIETPFDDLIPKTDDPEAQFYLDAMRIYLALCAGSIPMETALQAVDVLRANPEYATFPTNPAMIPINNRYKTKILDNLKTLKKFNLITRDSIRSAYSFAFLMEDSVLSTTDHETLSLFSRNPTISLAQAASELNLTSRTVARALERLRERHSLRFTALVDFTAFNLQSVLVFFTLKEGSDWSSLERGLARFPLTKTILKTTMTDLGYVTFLIPNIDQHKQVFQASLREVAREFFDYTSPHYQLGNGATSNLSLYSGGEWRLPEYLPGDITEHADALNEPPIIHCRGVRPELSKMDLAVATHLQIDSRAPPSRISTNLAVRGFDIEPRKVAQSEKRLKDRGLILPYVLFGGLGLSSNFCFEIVCNERWKSRTLRIVSQFPWSMYYTSNRGIIVWTISPGTHQVEYYQMFRALEQNPGVEIVNPIMTIAQGGSRSLLDITKDYSYDDGRWDIKSSDVDLRNFVFD